MSKYNVIYGPIHEVITDKKSGNDGPYYESDLPHGKYLLKEMCKNWNDMNMQQYFDGILKDKIQSAIMKPQIITNTENEKEYYGKVEIIGVPNFRFTERIREEIADQMDAQFCDGWGEGFFGCETFEVEDGVWAFVE